MKNVDILMLLNVNSVHVMLIYCYSILARFDCASNIKIEHLTFEENVFKINVPKSKTDQEGNGQSFYLLHESVTSPQIIV